MSDLLREAHPSERDTIEDVLKRLYPKQRQQIDDLIDDIEDDEKAEVDKSRFVEGWTGDISAGASSSSGNNEEWSLTASADIKRKGVLWEHQFKGDLDITETEGERTEESLSARYRLKRDFANSPWFVFGSLAFERDRPSGINSRFTEAIGPGFQIIDSDDIDWDVSAGPALRQTSNTDGEQENRLALYLATDFKWDVTDTITIKQGAGLAIAEDNTSARSETSLSTNIYGKLSSKLSFEIEYESDPPDGKKQLDTATKFTLSIGL